MEPRAAAEFPRRLATATGEDADETTFLVERVRVGLNILIVGLTIFLALEMAVRNANLTALAMVRIAQVVSLSGLWLVLRRERSRRFTVALGLVAIAVLCSGQALAGIVAEDLMISTLVAMALVVATAALMPWGVAAQLGTIPAVVLPLLANAWFVKTRPPDFGLALAAIAMACGASLYVAFEVQRFERRRRAAERELDELRRMEQEIAEQTARQREEELIETRKFVEKVADATPHILYVFDVPERAVTYVNGQTTRILGYPVEDVHREGLSFLIDHIHPDDLAHTIEGARERVADVPPDGVVEAELRVRHADGRWRWIHSRNIVFTRAPDGEPLQILGTAQDISERKQADERTRAHEAELAHVLRVSSLGEMAAGIAHELNQPLASIVGFAKGCARRLRTGRAAPETFADVMDQIAGEALRAGEIIRRLRSLVRKEEPLREPVDANDLVRGVARLLEPEARRLGVRVELRLASELPELEVDRIQIEQVVMNLVRNAFDAMAEMPQSARLVSLCTAVDDDGCVQIAVSDRGKGLREEDVEHIFEPFFTTKQTGLGMGLSISRSIAEAHAGRLCATANRDVGATFTLILPSAHSHAADVEAPPASSAASR
ncbi:MAG: ATP-binding protein [Thermodesulfobacteriota bacterium]